MIRGTLNWHPSAANCTRRTRCRFKVAQTKWRTQCNHPAERQRDVIERAEG
jgi:hypothetical protein